MERRDKLYLIKDLSRLSGHSIYTIKFYLKIGLIKETGRSPETRFRYFDDTTLEQLSTIRALRKQRKSLTEIKRLLDETDGSGHVPTTPSPQPGARGA